MVCIVMMIQPKLEFFIYIVYFVSVCIAFTLNGENLIHFFIHIFRSFWFISIVSYVLNNRFDRKKLILFDDEKKILDQLCEGKIYQKEVEGFSENTIYRKLKATNVAATTTNASAEDTQTEQTESTTVETETPKVEPATAEASDNKEVEASAEVPADAHARELHILKVDGAVGSSYR